MIIIINITYKINKIHIYNEKYKFKKQTSMMENASTVSVANIRKKTAQNHRIYLDNFRGSRSKFLNRDSRSKSNGNRFNINKIS